MRYFWRESFTFSFPVLTIFRSAFFSASAQTISVLVFVAVSLCEAFGVGEGGGGSLLVLPFPKSPTNGSAPRDNYG